MGRQVRRVPLDFSWPLGQVWEGFINPYVSRECQVCLGSGLSRMAKHLKDRWYGYIPFSPSETGSVPYSASDEIIWNFACRNVNRSPEFYGSDSDSIHREAVRLSSLFNSCWCHHLDLFDVSVLIKDNRLCSITHDFDPVRGWIVRDPLYIPSPREVNDWSISGMGHDSINQYIVARAHCERANEPHHCLVCSGDGRVWESDYVKSCWFSWEPEEVPEGDGYQLWETVSEGSPISPVFATPEELADYASKNPWGSDLGHSYDVWLRFICGHGWSPSGTINGFKLALGISLNQWNDYVD